MIQTEKQKFFYVRGYMKSGTNWLCNVLNLHPEIRCIGEFHWHRLLGPLESNLERLGQFTKNEELSKSVMANFVKLVQDAMVQAADCDATWIGDRNPSQIELNLFPGSPAFHILRDGRDVMVSRIFHIFNKPHVTALFEKNERAKRLLKQFQENTSFFNENPKQLFFNENVFRSAAQNWKTTVSENLKTIRKNPQRQFLEIRYEALHQDTEKMRTRMYRFLDLDPELARPLDQKTTPGFKEKPDAFYRKGAVGDWQTYFNDNARTWFKEEAGDLLIELGYADSNDW